MTTPIREGEILAGKYRVDRVLGTGGMGVVVAAHHIDLDEKVAIKFLLPETLNNPEAVARFAREARAAVKIKSEHVARVSDVGKLENGAPYMVMEHLDGGDLADWIRQRGALPVDQAVEFTLQACEAIAEAHALGIVHRDLKPANLFVIKRPDGGLSVKVLDFGISKMTGFTGTGQDASMTRTSALMGSPLYMSPEQLRSSRDVDSRGDIWAIGVILYELVTGVAPFGGETMPELILQITTDAPPPIRNKRPDAPDGLEAVIFKCLDKDRGKRYESVAELAFALLPFAPKRSKQSVERISGVMKAAGFSGSALVLPPSSDNQNEGVADAGTAASWGSTTSGSRRGVWLLFGGLGSVVAIGVAVTLLHKPATAEQAASPVDSSQPASVSPPPQAAAKAPTVAPAEPDVAPTTSAASSSAPIAHDAPIAERKPKDAPQAKHEAAAKPAASAASAALPPAPQAQPAPPPPASPPKPAKPTDEWGEGRL